MKTFVTVCMALLRQTTTIEKEMNQNYCIFVFEIKVYYLRMTSAFPVIPKKNIKT
jgi:hypothetical protein